jgi:hypothetical protein
MFGLVVMLVSALPVAAQTQGHCPDYGSDTIPCGDRTASQAMIFQSDTPKEVCIVVDPGECTAVLSWPPRKPGEGIDVRGRQKTVCITAKEITIVCLGSAGECTYRIVQISNPGRKK